jgi:hypothetical protein
MKHDTYTPFYGWLILAGLILFGSFLLWQHGLWEELLKHDQTYISRIVLGLFTIMTLYLGWMAFKLSRESHKTHAQPLQNGWASDYLGLLNEQSAEPLQARLVEQVHGGHQSGWFISDLLLRLGLIGTVIGFVLMLSSVYELQSDGVHALKQLMTSMGGGMQVALYTTLSGLGGSMLVSIQCHWLDRCADKLVSDIVALGAKAGAKQHQGA